MKKGLSSSSVLALFWENRAIKEKIKVIGHLK